MEFSDGRPVGEQIGSGVVITLKLLIGFAVTCLMLFGLHLLFFPESGNPNRFAGRHPSALGAILLTIATVILNATIQRWVTILPGILAYCAFRALRVAALGLILGSRMPVPGSTVLFLTIVLLADTVLSITFVLRDLNLPDRFSLIGFVYCLGISMLTNQPISLYMAPTAGSCLLLLAWLVERSKHPSLDHVPDLTELEAQRQWHLAQFTESTARRLRERRRGRGGLRSRFNLRF